MRYGSRYYYRPHYHGEGQLALPAQESSRMEKTLHALAASGPGVSRSLMPNSYVAIVERSPEVELGTPAAREEASFHVILGRW
jgi:hypothetical protein